MRCDVLISKTPPADYDANYYYFRANARSTESIERAMALWRHFANYIGSCTCLDFGCNDGSFVEVATRNGARCEGTDINERAVALAKTIGCGLFWSPQDLAGRRFECITAFDVIEHFDEVNDFFKSVDNCLEANGLLVITTPNKNSKWRRLYGEEWHGFGIPQYHRIIVSEYWLRHQLEQHGFEVEKVFSRAPIEPQGWKLLVASGYRLRNGVVKKLAALPIAVTKFIVGRTILVGEEDTLCVIARKTRRG